MVDNASVYAGDDMVYRVRKNGALLFDSKSEATAVAADAAAQGYSFSVRCSGWSYLVEDQDQ